MKNLFVQQKNKNNYSNEYALYSNEYVLFSSLALLNFPIILKDGIQIKITYLVKCF